MEKERAQIRIVETDDGVRIDITGNKLKDICCCCCSDSDSKSESTECCPSDEGK